MSFEDEVRGMVLVRLFHAESRNQDLLAAIGHVKKGNTVAAAHRKRAASLPTRLAGLLVGSLNTTGIGWISSMTPVERHAELVYAETLYERVSRYTSVLCYFLHPLSYRQ